MVITKEESKNPNLTEEEEGELKVIAFLCNWDV